MLNLMMTHPCQLKESTFVFETLLFWMPLSFNFNVDELESGKISFAQSHMSLGQYNMEDPIDGLSVAHRLQTVNIEFLKEDTIHSHLPIHIQLPFPWNQLTDLSISGISIPISTMILLQCVQLVHSINTAL
jgi:hypothetical protein